MITPERIENARARAWNRLWDALPLPVQEAAAHSEVTGRWADWEGGAVRVVRRAWCPRRDRLVRVDRIVVVAEGTRSTLWTRLDLRDADLRGVDLRGVDLRDADLRGVDLRGVYLRDVDLRDVDLRGVDLRGVYLHGADLRGVDLRGVYLRGADLHYAAHDTTTKWPEGFSP